MKNKPEAIAPVIAILCITALLVVALLNNINSGLFATGTAIIGGLGGFTLRKLVKRD